MKIKKFNEGFDKNEELKVEVKVKDLISYLQSLDPEMLVHLDKDGWDYKSGMTGLEVVENSYLFYVSNFNNTQPTLTINN